jgi:hypothetical protein
MDVTTTPESLLSSPPRHLPIDQAVLRAVAYADVFEYPLRAAEVHRYLHGVPATLDVTAEALTSCSVSGNALSYWNGYYTLPGREGLVEVRRRRAAHASQLWPAAVKYGRLIAGLPFVRMVAVTGALAWDNVEGGADIDYMIVTEPDRLWLCRWLVAALGRLAHRDGVSLCPNYVVSMRALALADRNLYTAYELARMAPIAGLGMHRRLRRANPWAMEFLPNTEGPPPRPPHTDTHPTTTRTHRALARLARLGEKAMRSPLGAVLERREMTYRIRKRATQGVAQSEASYGLDWYKEHTSGHGHRALAAFADRLRGLGTHGS